MIDRLIRTPIRSVEAFGDTPHPRLFPEEWAVVANSVAKRRMEFATGRECAHQALHQLNVPPAPLLPGSGGAPQWPAGTVGSITHCTGYRAAAVARAVDIAAIGIDAEPHLGLPERVLSTIASSDERQMIDQLIVRFPRVHWDRLLFCAKEAVFKAIFPVTGVRLGFDGAVIVFDPIRCGFTAQMTGSVATYTGRWLVAEGLLLATMVIGHNPGVSKSGVRPS